MGEQIPPELDELKAKIVTERNRQQTLLQRLQQLRNRLMSNRKQDDIDAIEELRKKIQNL
jgi:hypothetical protein